MPVSGPGGAGVGDWAMFEEIQLFSMRERSVGGTTVVELSGEVDILAATRTSGRLDALTSSLHPDLVMDLRAVTFIDCSGLSLLVRARRRVVERGGRLAVVSDSPSVLRLLRLTRLAAVFVVHEDLASALAAEPPGAANGAIA
ncbi:MAG: sulfate transporter [Streptomyces oryziradicis]|jgi:anti-sigma B factor antagonist|nr:sulfate transporter [Actinacidiphila oryziradicis]